MTKKGQSVAALPLFMCDCRDQCMKLRWLLLPFDWFIERSEAIQNPSAERLWIASLRSQ